VHKRLAMRMATAFHIRRICATAGLVVFLAVSLGCPAGFAAEPKRVMLLHSFGREFRPWSEYAKAIRIELNRQSPWPLDIHDHSLITARFSDKNAELAFVEYLRALYSERPLDLIIGLGAPAASFVQRHREQLFPVTPMLYTAVEQRRVQYSSLTENDAVVALPRMMPLWRWCTTLQPKLHLNGTANCPLRTFSKMPLRFHLGQRSSGSRCRSTRGGRTPR